MDDGDDCIVVGDDDDATAERKGGEDGESLLSQASSIVSRRTQGIPDSQFSLHMEELEEEENKLNESYVSTKAQDDDGNTNLGSHAFLSLISLNVASQVSLRMKPLEDGEIASSSPKKAMSEKDFPSNGGAVSQISMRMKPIDDDDDDDLLLLDL